MFYKITNSMILFQIALVCFLQPSFAAEMKGDSPWERVSINLGGFSAAIDSGARLGTSGVGIDIDFEEALGLESTTSVFWIDARYRISKNLKHGMDFGYYDMRRNNTKVLQQEIDWNGQTYTAGTTIHSYFNIQVYRVGYNYSYFLDDRFDLSSGIGLFIMPLKVGISSTTFGDAGTDFTSPLPYFSLNMSYAITPKWFIKEQLKIFYLQFDEFEGGMNNNTIAVEYNGWENIGLGLALDSMRMTIKANDEDYPEVDFTGEIEHKYVALLLYLKVVF